ncbi:MAG: type II secretion system protein GspM [Pseudomonadota bacterium]
MTLNQLQAALRERWARLETRERRMVLAAGSLILLALLWWVAVQPALRTTREAPLQIARLESSLQQMRAMAAEAEQLRGTPAVNASQAAAALKAAAQRLGTGARLNLQGDRATVTLQGVRGEALLAFLGEARSTARARPLEAQLTRSGDAYNGSLVLALPSAP